MTHKPGDTVTLERGDERLTATLIRDPDGQTVFPVTLALRGDLLHMEANGWRVTNVEPALTPLPTDDGIYNDSTGCTWQRDGVNHFWRIMDGFNRSPDPREYAPFVKLVPEAEARAAGVEEAADTLRLLGYSSAAGALERALGSTP